MFFAFFLFFPLEHCLAFRGMNFSHESKTRVAIFPGPTNILSRYLLERHSRFVGLLTELGNWVCSSAPPDNFVEVNYELELVHIINVDELKQTMQFLVYIVEVFPRF